LSKRGFFFFGENKEKGARFFGGKKDANSSKSDGLEPDYNIGRRFSNYCLKEGIFWGGNRVKGARFFWGKRDANSSKSDGLEPDYNIGRA